MQLKNKAKIYFLTGGVRSGKSQYGENLAGNLSCKVGYLATAIITDEEMNKRISLHKKRRPESWITFELDNFKNLNNLNNLNNFSSNNDSNDNFYSFSKIDDIAEANLVETNVIENNLKAIKEIFNSVVKLKLEVLIVDCVTNLLFRLINSFNIDGSLEKSELIDNTLEEKIENVVKNFFNNFLELLTKLKKQSNVNVIIISNEVGMGLVPPNPLGRVFRDLQGEVNKKIAAVADEVLFFVSGVNIKIK